jgi:hypothetical protein
VERQEILKEVEGSFGLVPGWLTSFPDPQLDLQWAQIKWVLSDSKLTAHEKALVAFGAAAAVHCPY